MENKRDGNVNYDFFEMMEVKLKWYQPWQLGLWLPDSPTFKFVWYPERGTLMVDYGEYNNKKLGEFTDSEDVYNAMITVYKNQNR